MKLLLWILLFSRILRIFWNRRNKVTYSYAFACIVGINLMSKKRLKKYSYRLVKFHYCLIDIREEIASKNYNYWLDSKLILKKYQYLFFLIYEWKWSNHEIHEILIDKLIRSSLCFSFTKHASSFFKKYFDLFESWFLARDRRKTNREDLFNGSTTPFQLPVFLFPFHGHHRGIEGYPLVKTYFWSKRCL